MSDAALTAGLLVAALAAALAGGIMIARSRGWLFAVAIVLLRGAVLGLVACLLSLAWRSRAERITGRPVDTEEENVCIFLQDLSQSMAFMTAEGRSRNELAEEAWRDFKELARQTESRSEHGAADVPQKGGGLGSSVSSVGSAAMSVGLVPRRMFFARNLVAERESAKLESDATNMVAALTSCLGREEVRSVVVVSDGASTDGTVPEHVLDWARNRGASVYAVCAADPAGRIADVSVQGTDCPVTNPLRIDVDVACEGLPEGHAGTLELAIDGVSRGSRRVRLRTRSTFQLDVPELDRGWHAYAVRVRADRPEITTVNNVAHGVFRVAPAQTLVYLLGRPRPDNRHAVRILRGLWPERLRVMYARGGRLLPYSGGGAPGASGASDREAEINVRNVRLAILADVSPHDLPPALLEAIDGGEVVSMILAGEALYQWAGRAGPAGRGTSPVPLARAGRVVELEEDETRAVAAGEAAERCGLGGMKLDGVGVGFVHGVELRPPSEVLLRAGGSSGPAGGGGRPLLVADRTTSPRSIVLLTDVAWKWALHPEPEVRAAYGELWEGLTRWILVEDVADDPLDVSFAPHPADPDTTLVSVAATGLRRDEAASAALSVPRGAEPDANAAQAGEEPPAELSDVRLVIRTGLDAGGAEATVRPGRREGRWVFPYTCRKRPRVAWFEAFATSGGAELRSARKPLALPVSNMEFLDIKPHPERMSRYAPGEDHFAYWRDRAGVLERALEFSGASPVEYRRSPEERKAGKEAALALACFLLVACEWLIERRAYAGRQGQQGQTG